MEVRPGSQQRLAGRLEAGPLWKLFPLLGLGGGSRVVRILAR